jgi:hypothetical protein
VIGSIFGGLVVRCFSGLVGRVLVGRSVGVSGLVGGIFSGCSVVFLAIRWCDFSGLLGRVLADRLVRVGNLVVGVGRFGWCDFIGSGAVLSDRWWGLDDLVSAVFGHLVGGIFSGLVGGVFGHLVGGIFSGLVGGVLVVWLTICRLVGRDVSGLVVT